MNLCTQCGKEVNKPDCHFCSEECLQLWIFLQVQIKSLAWMLDKVYDANTRPS